MHDADAGRDDAESFERLLAPFQQFVALAVARKFEFKIQLQRVGAAEKIHLHRVIHDEIHGHERLDHFRIAPEPRDGRAHRGEVHEQRHAGEVLQHHARDDEGNLDLRGCLCVPVRERAHVFFSDFFSVAIAQHGFEHDADGDREFRDRPDALFFQRGQAEKFALLSVPQCEIRQRLECVVAHVVW